MESGTFIVLLVVLMVIVITHQISSRWLILNRVSESGVNIFAIGVTLFALLTIFDLPIISMRYGVKLESATGEAAVFASAGAIIFGVILFFIGKVFDHFYRKSHSSNQNQRGQNNR